MAQPSVDQEAGGEFMLRPQIHPGVSSQVFQGVQVPNSRPAPGTPHASLYEAWRQGPADSSEGPFHQGTSLQQAMPSTSMDDDISTGPHDIPTLHAGVPSTGEFSYALCHSMT